MDRAANRRPSSMSHHLPGSNHGNEVKQPGVSITMMLGWGVIEVIMLQRVKVGKYSHYQTEHPCKEKGKKEEKKVQKKAWMEQWCFLFFFMMIV